MGWNPVSGGSFRDLPEKGGLLKKDQRYPRSFFLQALGVSSKALGLGQRPLKHQVL
jgi:hypothetical protein